MRTSFQAEAAPFMGVDVYGSERLGCRPWFSQARFCCGSLQGEKKNTNIFAQEIDGIAGIRSEALLADCRLVLMNGLSHQLDCVVHFRHQRWEQDLFSV
jgi:hypothetical protein